MFDNLLYMEGIKTVKEIDEKGQVTVIMFSLALSILTYGFFRLNVC